MGVTATLETIVQLRQRREDKALAAFKREEAVLSERRQASAEAQAAVDRNHADIIAHARAQPGATGGVRLAITAFHHAAAKLSTLQARRLQCVEAREACRRQEEQAQASADAARATWIDQRVRREKLEDVRRTITVVCDDHEEEAT